MTANIVAFAKEYLAANAAESGADALIDNLVDEIERLRAALRAQEDASVALNGRVGYDKYQALQDKADELRRQALAP